MIKGNGLFEQVSNNNNSQSDPRTWIMTPKYQDPYASDANRKMAKFIIPLALREAIDATVGAQGGDTNAVVQGNNILRNLSNQSRGYFDFFLQSAEESFEEKFQIMETLGDSYAVYGLGKKPRIWSYSGVLLNSQENDWRVNFIKMFDDYISISRLAKFRKNTLNNQVNLIYDSFNIRGAILNLRTSLRSDNELATPFGFTMLVTKLTSTNVLRATTSFQELEEDEPVISLFTDPENTGNVAVSETFANQQLAFIRATG